MYQCKVYVKKSLHLDLRYLVFHGGQSSIPTIITLSVIK